MGTTATVEADSDARAPAANGSADRTPASVTFDNDLPSSPPVPHDDGSAAVTTPGDTADSDRDADYVPDSVDNCPDLANPDQADTGGDGVGDACDPVLRDLDADSTVDRLDNCRTVPNADQFDGDGDGLGDACDADPEVPIVHGALHSGHFAASVASSTQGWALDSQSAFDNDPYTYRYIKGTHRGGGGGADAPETMERFRASATDGLMSVLVAFVAQAGMSIAG